MSKARMWTTFIVLGGCLVVLLISNVSWEYKATSIMAALIYGYLSSEWARTLERIHRLEHRLGLEAVEDDVEWRRGRPSLGYKD